MYKLLFGNTFSAMDGHASCEREQRASLSQRPDTAGYECRRLDKFMATQNQLAELLPAKLYSDTNGKTQALTRSTLCPTAVGAASKGKHFGFL